MELYNSNKELVRFSDEEVKSSIKYGAFGSIYRYGEEDCLKIYNREKDMPDYARLSLDVYMIHGYLKSNNVVDIKDVYFSSLSDFPNKIVGYLMKYYQNSVQSILDMPKDYLIANQVSLLNFAKRCSELGILFKDIKIKNTMFTDDFIVLLDPDLWEFDPGYSLNELNRLNSSAITGLIYDIICLDLSLHYWDMLYESNIRSLDIANELITLKHPENSVSVLSRRLEGFSKPIDYVRKRCR